MATNPPRQNALYLNAGLFSAIGGFGVTFVNAPSETTEIEVGMGYGVSGFQLSLMPKLALGSKSHRLLLGVGPSMALGSTSFETATLWFNGDIGYEYRADSGFSLALSAGLTKGLTGCWSKNCGDTEGEWGSLNSSQATDWAGPQARIAIGKWF